MASTFLKNKAEAEFPKFVNNATEAKIENILDENDDMRKIIPSTWRPKLDVVTCHARDTVVGNGQPANDTTTTYFSTARTSSSYEYELLLLVPI